MPDPTLPPPPGHGPADDAAGLAASSTTSARPWTSWPTCCAATTGSARCRTASAAPRRCAAAGRRAPVDAVFLDIRMPGLDGMELARVLARFAHRPRSCSSPRTRSTPSTRSSCARSTTCSSRCAPSGSPRPYAGCSPPPDAGDRDAPAERRGRDDPGRARRRHPFVPALAGPLRRGAGRLRPAAHRRRAPPRPHRR